MVSEEKLIEMSKRAVEMLNMQGRKFTVHCVQCNRDHLGTFVSPYSFFEDTCECESIIAILKDHEERVFTQVYLSEIKWQDA